MYVLTIQTPNILVNYNATSNEILVENSKNGLYGISQTNDKQTYADFMVNINKNI
ncbi:hypothetical protein KUBF_29630 [Bacteroides finegoldii]|nr:hypothetical protein KUBF_29630 [Bacteroides finegoldii]